MKKIYKQPIVEQMEVNGSVMMDTVGVSIVSGSYSGGGSAPKRRGDVIE